MATLFWPYTFSHPICKLQCFVIMSIYTLHPVEIKWVSSKWVKSWKKGPVIKEGPYGLFPPYERMLILRGVKEGEWICILDYWVSWEII